MKLFYYIFNAVLIVSGIIWGFSSWSSLPDTIPIHFSFSGIPDRWTTKGVELIILIFFPLFMSLFLYGLLTLVRKYPDLLNIPDKEKFLALPAEKQKPLWDMLSEFITLLALLCSVLSLSLYYSIVQVAMGINTNISWIVVLIFILFAAGIIIYIKKLLKVLKDCLLHSPSMNYNP